MGNSIAGRRTFLLGGMALALSRHCGAARAAPRRIGIFIHTRVGDAAVIRVLRERLAAAGFVEGRDVVLHVESTELDDARIPQAARRLLAERPDVLYALNEPLVEGLLDEKRAIPLVFNGVTEPVRRGWVRELARPGGHVTGVTDRYVEVGVKRLELLREIAPGARRVGIVRSHDDELGLDTWMEAGRRLRFEVDEIYAARQGVALEAALSAAHARGVDSLFPLGLLRDPAAPAADGITTFMGFVSRTRLPVVFSSTQVVERIGGLASLEIDFDESKRLSADMVVRVLRGEKPAAMPVQEPDHFVVALNLATARKQGIAFPRSVLLRATRLVD